MSEETPIDRTQSTEENSKSPSPGLTSKIHHKLVRIEEEVKETGQTEGSETTSKSIGTQTENPTIEATSKPSVCTQTDTQAEVKCVGSPEKKLKYFHFLLAVMKMIPSTCIPTSSTPLVSRAQKKLVVHSILGKLMDEDTVMTYTKLVIQSVKRTIVHGKADYSGDGVLKVEQLVNAIKTFASTIGYEMTQLDDEYFVEISNGPEYSIMVYDQELLEMVFDFIIKHL